MEFGIFDHLDRRDGEPLQRTYAERLALIGAAEEAGFHSYHLAEHHGTPLGMAPSPNVFLAAVASRTTRLRLGPLVYLLPLYIPLRLIEEICLLDNLSGGRLDVGVGRGVSPVETGFYGVSPEASVALYVETLDVLRKGLSHDRLDHRGEHFRYDDVPMVLRPVQSPVPFWCAAASPESQVFAAQAGMNIVSLGAVERVKTITAFYKDAWLEHAGHPLRRFQSAEEPLIGAYRLVFAAETDAQAETLARRAYRVWFEKLAKLWREHGLDTHFLTLERYETAREQGMLLAGSVSRVRDELAAQIETCGFNYTLLQVAFGDLGHAAEMRSLALLAERVLPEVRRL